MIRNEYRIEGTKVYIKLRRRKAKFVEAIIDTEVFQTVVSIMDLRWQARWNKDAKTFYVQARLAKNPSKFLQLHRLLLNIQDRSHLEIIGNHKDFNGLNNCLDNLEAVSRSRNQLHSVGMGRNTSGYRNVTWNKNEQKWQGGFQYTVNGVRHFKRVGVFDDPKEAYEAVQKVRPAYFDKA